MIEKGRPWGRATGVPADVHVHGDDVDLGAALDAAAGRLVRFEPSPGSDLARALGLGSSTPGATEVALDGLRVEVPGRPARTAVNAVVLGPGPDRLRPWHRSHAVRVEVDGRERFAGRATTVVVASGQFLRGLDVVPRGHPGDGRVEVQVYALGPRERPAMRRRLPQGTHVPHPRVAQASGRRICIRAGDTLPLEVDGRPSGRADHVTIDVAPAALRLLI